MAYRRRILDDFLDEVFPDLRAISFEGAKGVGKTATASQRAVTTVDLTDELQRPLIEADARQVQRRPGPVLIDEWQLVPPVWDAVRRGVDDAIGGPYLLTGSATVAPGTRIHSGAGRIVSVRMRPLSIAERGVCEPTVSMAELLAGGSGRVGGLTDVAIEQYTDEIVRSGFPGIRDLPETLRSLQLDSYITRAIERELPENGALVRRPGALRAWLAAYAAATSTDTGWATILDAATPGEGDKPARQTVVHYREHLTRLFLLDPVAAWTPVFSPLDRLKLSEKHHLVDPALAARLVGVGRNGLLTGGGRRVGAVGGTWLGALFESLVAQSVRVYADAAGARVGHLKSRNNDREIDLVVERADHAVAAIEVKLGGAVDDRDVRHLNWLQAQLGDRLIERVVVNTGPGAYRRPDGVAVVPLALLGP